MTTPWRKIKQKIELDCSGFGPGLDPQVFVMCSGGADSQFLLDFMAKTCVRFDVLHFAHGIRSAEETQKDIDVIFNYVQELNQDRENPISIHVGHGSGLTDISNQEAEAHKQRWAFVEQQRQRVVNQFYASKKYEIEKRRLKAAYSNREPDEPFVYAITAHHQDDAIESVFLNLMRGKDHTNLNMKQKTFFPGLIRYKPLLEVSKAEILNQVAARHIPFHEDVTNTDNKNDRNWLRNEIIPEMMKRRNLNTSMAEAMQKHY